MSWEDQKPPRYLTKAMCAWGTNNVTKIRVPPPMPAVIIFIHGVNSEGEWYQKTEESLLAGLGNRLGRTDFEANKYSDDKRTLLQINESPVIRFFWGYRAAKKETIDGRFSYKIPLRRRERAYERAEKPYNYIPYIFKNNYKDKNENKPGEYYWGGGPYQNGMTALNMAWYDGFNPKYFGGLIDMAKPKFNPYCDRALNAAPKRTYTINAALRLAKLIDSIYEKYPDDTIAIVSHSQGTMVALLAMLYVKRVPDTLLLCNSPYCLEDKETDFYSYGDKTPTASSRIDTFLTILRRFDQSKKDRDRKVTDAQISGVGGYVNKCSSFYSGMPEAAEAEAEAKAKAKAAYLDRRQIDTLEGSRNRNLIWNSSLSSEQPVPGEENHHNHGRVFVYFSPHDRVMGSLPLQSIGWKGIDYKLPDLDPHDAFPISPFKQFKDVLYQRQFMRSYAVGSIPDRNGPGTPRYPDDNTQFWMPEPAKVMGLFDDLGKVDKDALTYINAPRVPHPFTAEEMREFDSKFPSEITIAKDEDYLFNKQLLLEKRKMVTVAGDAKSESKKVRRLQTLEEIEAEMLSTYEIATEHGTIFEYASGALVKRVMAFDIPIGRADSFRDFDFWKSLIKQADWLEEGSDPDYQAGGDFNAPPVPPGLNLRTRAVAAAEKREFDSMYKG